MSKRMIAAFAALAISAGAGGTASAQDVKIGLILPYTGPGAELSPQMDKSIDLYQKLNAAQIKPYKLTIITRDSKAPNGVAAKIDTQELLTQEKADIIAGYIY